jgi:hypothetical protein
MKNYLLIKDVVGQSRRSVCALPSIEHRYGSSLLRDKYSAADLLSEWDTHTHVHQDKGYKDFELANRIAVSHKASPYKISNFRKSVDFVKHPRYDSRPTAS